MVGRMERMLEMVETMTYPGFDLGSPRRRVGKRACRRIRDGWGSRSSGTGTAVAA
jgi:hypothetical protein